MTGEYDLPNYRREEFEEPLHEASCLLLLLERLGLELIGAYFREQEMALFRASK